LDNLPFKDTHIGLAIAIADISARLALPFARYLDQGKHATAFKWLMIVIVGGGEHNLCGQGVFTASR
jgi:hypothetical protein